MMLPLDMVGSGGQLSRQRAVPASLMALRGAGVDGVMVDVWWGVVEREGPGHYDWEAYAELVRMVERAGLGLPLCSDTNGTWRFPGIGEFQCYDKYMRASLEAAAVAAGHEEWGSGGPHDAGEYKQMPEETGFFRRDGTWSTEYGKFILEWYSGMLLASWPRLRPCSAARARRSRPRSPATTDTMGPGPTRRSSQPGTTTRGTATGTRLAKRGAVLNFTCMELKDEQQPQHASCSPEQLVRQVKAAASAAGVELAGENALERYERRGAGGVHTLFDGDNWRQFLSFVMADGGTRPALPRCDTGHSDLYVGFLDAAKERKAPEAEGAATATAAAF
ncbi:beta-amylase 3, chloroplastic [Panicum miliaceum]|uniref:Beta-amylase n=1 Tax=Panicum miliaceum TaxID=4540 RepID=A0A3L6TJ89_PANMI|nr:beta-amylase 3, chloroplastic [Panicum miliaceum]